ncbi:MAG TPA: bifunctional serine/threonine-protein kinase/formylglycine-generating enzyme family protein [Longimicrobiales bacterium]|nr:bifunctional serine/threonine-protein kinase/formylglycine-generating enzyme family protein [Longimicrobiales bacterium]
MTRDPTPPSPADDLVEDLADRYRIEGVLGEGATAEVYLASDLKHDRRVALKVLRAELAALVGVDRFLSEIRTTANLQNPHILPLFDSGEAAGRPFYVMPYVEGESLRDRLDREGPLPVGEALRVVDDVATALSHAHARGVVHRDLKPANILLSEGEALVADFGVALALSDLGTDRHTATGLSVGTPWYMSPEQIEADRPVDARSDVYALGCLAFEMLTGTRPFEAESLQGVLAKALTERPPRVSARRPEVPADVARAVARALEKDPEDRFPSVAAFAEACRVPETAPGGTSRRVSVAVLSLAVIALAVGGWFGWRTMQRAGARAALPEIAALVDEGRYVEAYDRAVAAERWIAGDSALVDLMTATSDVYGIASDPAGAEVRVQRFDPESAQAPEPVSLGVTPLERVRLPRADHRLMVELDEYHPVEMNLSSELIREFAGSVATVEPIDLTLTPAYLVPEGMVPVPGGDYQLSSPDAPTTLSASLEPFFIDRTEVANDAFLAFMTDGGYGDDRWWTDVPDADRATLPATLVDRTGLPGPREWSRGRFPDGADRLPVSGVTWWEAQAYCRWDGGRLPTVFEWEMTARAGLVARQGVAMPWGIQSTTQGGGRRANFNSEGPVAVDAFPFGVSRFGAYGMAGNVSEWTLNRYGEGRAVTGGSWQGPSYLYTEYASEPPHFTSQGLGFRCARSEGEADQGRSPIDLDVRPPDYEPVDRATFESFLDFYRYDPLPPRPRVTDVEETDAWVRERLWIDGAAGDSILIYLWTPRAAAPPYQTMVFVPGSSVFFSERMHEDVEWTVGPAIQAGRAVMAVVMQGMLERPFPPGAGPPPPPSVGFRDLMVRHATELRLGIDYLETRDDIDAERLAYVATSWGAGSRLSFAAVDDRYRAAVLIGAGIDERVKPTLPEADNVNFAPYLDVPTLMINGSNDEEHPWLSRAQPLWELLSEPKELVLAEGAGHIPPAEVRIPAMNEFLDRILGPVSRPRVSR